MRYFVFVLLVVGVCAKKRYDGHKLVSVFAKGKPDADFLHALESDSSHFEGLDFWTEPSAMFPTDIRVSPNDFVKLRNVLMDAGLDFKVTKDDVQIDIDIEEESMRRASARNTGLCDIYGQYCSLAQIDDLLNNFFTTSSLMNLVTIGYSVENRPIKMARIGSDLNVYKPAIIIEAGTHAREWISISSALVLMDTLLSESPRAYEMMEDFDWYIVPVHNPDGYDYTNTERYWRKNRSPCNSFWTGIDLNRNWGTGFGGLGSSSNCRDDTYSGQYAFEANETAALLDAYNSIRQNAEVFAFFSIHCYSQMMLVPYAYTTSKPANYDHLYDVATLMMGALETIDGRKFSVGTPPELLNVAGGGAYDYFYEELGVPYSYTYELRPGPGMGLSGFALPVSEIEVATRELVESLWYFAWQLDHFQGRKY